MRSILKPAVFYGVMIAIPLLFLELISGYYLLQSGGIFEPAVYRLSRSLRYQFSREQAMPSVKRPVDGQNTKVFSPDNKNNPFIMNAPDVVQARFHPLLDYSYAAIETKKPDLSDFFGFRNKSNLYFSDRDKGTLLIVMTGGSECLGFTHPKETIIENMQRKLQLHTERKVQALNLCMNSYTLANEVQAYVHLAYQFKPDLVITHSGWNDAMYGMLLSKEFVKTGFIYNKWQEAWIEKLYGSAKFPVRSDKFSDFDASNKDMQVTAYWNVIKKYRDIAAANGSKFLIGLQGYNPIVAEDDMAAAHRHAQAIVKEVHSAIPQGYDYIDFARQRGIHYRDSVHTSQDSVDAIADIYSNYIVNHYPELLTR